MLYRVIKILYYKNDGKFIKNECFFNIKFLSAHHHVYIICLVYSFSLYNFTNLEKIIGKQ